MLQGFIFFFKKNNNLHQSKLKSPFQNSSHTQWNGILDGLNCSSFFIVLTLNAFSDHTFQTPRALFQFTLHHLQYTKCSQHIFKYSWDTEFLIHSCYIYFSTVNKGKRCYSYYNVLLIYMKNHLTFKFIIYVKLTVVSDF